MPTYEYACTSCGQHVEVFQRISEAPLQTCGVCGGRLRKVFHPAGIVFKGSGFYATDSRSKPTSDAGANDGKKDDAGTKDAPGKPAGGAKTAASSVGGSKGSEGPKGSKDGSSGTKATSGEKAS